MTDPCLDIQEALGNQFNWLTVGNVSDGGNLFAHKMPPSPDFAVFVQRYEGRAPDETFTNPVATRHPRVQVMIRDMDSETALNRGEEIMKFLAGIKNQDVNGTFYQRIKPVGEPFEIGPDSTQRQRVSVNFEASFNDS